jgi:hypothetical protein
MQELQTEHDAAVSDWMENRGWPVTERHYDVSRAIHAWRSHNAKPFITLWITGNVVDDYSAVELVRILDRFKVAQRLSEAPNKFTILKTSDAGPPQLVQLDELPK